VSHRNVAAYDVASTRSASTNIEMITLGCCLGNIVTIRLFTCLKYSLIKKTVRIEFSVEGMPYLMYVPGSINRFRDIL
jgi:hypothetical protein